MSGDNGSNGKQEPAGKPDNAGAPIVKYKAELRKAIRRNAVEPEINFLNITAMLDIMTIILVFLLKTVGESSSSVPQSEDMTLPKSVIDTQPTQEGVTITISKSQILLGDNPVVTLPGRKSLAQSGVDAKHKRSGANDLYIVPLGSALQAARETDKVIRTAKGKDASFSEAMVIADHTTPYRLFMEVLFTLGQTEFGRYHLMVLQSKKD